MKHIKAARVMAGLAAILSFDCMAIDGIVSTLDGRKLEGEIEFAQNALLVKSAPAAPVTVSSSNIALARFSTNAFTTSSKGGGNGLLGIYYGSTNFGGVSVVRLDETLDFDWRDQAPTLGIPRDFFSVRWMGELEAPSTDAYTLHFAADDDGRLYLDGNLLANPRSRYGFTETNVTVNLNAGERHKLQIEYLELTGDARARLTWSTPSLLKTVVPRDRLYPASFDAVHKAEITGKEGLLATYYNSQNFTSYSFTRIDRQIEFDWRNVPPAPGISSNEFSVRWSGNLTVTNSGEYKFYLLAGRPMRCFINDRLINDPWSVAPEKTGTAILRGGERCELRLELRTTNGAVGAQFLWSGPGIEKSIVPARHLSPAIAPPGSSYGSPASDWPSGVVLRNGTIISAPIQKATEASLRFQGLLSRQPLSLSKVVRIHVRPLTREFAVALPKDRIGVLLKNRDFIDGDFAGIENGRVKVGSVLFGNRSFDMAKDVVAIVLRGGEPAPWRYAVSARDGTILYGRGTRIGPTDVGITEASEFALPVAQLTQIERRSEAE